MHLGPDEFLVVADVRFTDDLDTEEIARAIDRVEAAIREAEPGAARIYVEPEIRFREEAMRPDRVRVAVVAEYYPRAADPVLGVWAHRQALAARDAGADVRVLVLHRPVPSRAALRCARRRRSSSRFASRSTRARRPRVTYVPFVAPPRPRSYGRWGAWAAPTLALALRRMQRSFPFDLVHAHYAAPAGDAVRRARPGRAGRRLGPRRRRAVGRRAAPAADTAVTGHWQTPGSCSPTPPAWRRARESSGP